VNVLKQNQEKRCPLIMNNKVIFLDNINFIRDNFEYINEIIREESSVVIPLSDAAYLFLKNRGIECLDYHQFEGDKAHHDVYDTARRWAMHWYKAGGRDISMGHSYSMGNIIEWSMVYFFSHVLRLHNTISAIIDKNKVEEVVIITFKESIDEAKDIFSFPDVNISLLPDIISNCIESLGSLAKLRIIPLSYRISKHEASKLLVLIRQSCVYLNYLLSTLCRFFGIFLRKRKKILFFEGFRHFSSIMISPELKRFERIHLQKRIGPTLLFKLYRKGIRVETVDRPKKSALSKTPLFDIKKIKHELSDFFVYHNKNMFRSVWPRIEFLFKNLFPSKVYPDLIRMKTLITEIAPDCVITENDSTYYEKMLVVLAKSHNMPTTIMQNGATLYGNSYKTNGLMVHDFCPIIGNLFFSFGKASKEWLVNMNEDANKIIITGGARFDNYYKNQKRIKKNSGDKKTVLVLLNDHWFQEGLVTYHIGLNVLHNHMLGFINLVKRNPDISFIIRPHDKYNLWREIFKADTASLSNIIISRKGSIEQVFSRTDLVIGYLSTAVIEALIHRIPVISLDTGEYYNFLPLWEYGLSKKVSAFDELEEELKRQLFDKETRKISVENIDKNISLFNYDDDGRASERIANELAKVML